MPPAAQISDYTSGDTSYGRYITSEGWFVVAGYWLEPADGQGFSVVLFQTEEQAR